MIFKPLGFCTPGVCEIENCGRASSERVFSRNDGYYRFICKEHKEPNEEI